MTISGKRRRNSVVWGVSEQGSLQTWEFLSGCACWLPVLHMAFDNTKPLLPNRHKQRLPGETFWARFTELTLLYLLTSSCRGWGRGTALGKGESAGRVIQAVQARGSQSCWGSGVGSSAAGDAVAPDQMYEGKWREVRNISRGAWNNQGCSSLARWAPDCRRAAVQGWCCAQTAGGTPTAASPVPRVLRASAAHSACQQVLHFFFSLNYF